MGKMGTAKPNLFTPLSCCRAFCIVITSRWFRVPTLESDTETDAEKSCWTALRFSFSVCKAEASPRGTVAGGGAVPHAQWDYILATSSVWGGRAWGEQEYGYDSRDWVGLFC